MNVLESFAHITGWVYVTLTLFVGLPVGWYWAATEYQEEPWTPARAAIRTVISLWFAAAVLILLVLR